MSIIDDIRARLDKEHDQIIVHENGEPRTLSNDERADMLAFWAVNAYDESMTMLRRQRDALLAASDWTQVSDAPVDAKAWAAYRQELRDFPATITDPTAEVNWPEPPK